MQYIQCNSALLALETFAKFGISLLVYLRVAEVARELNLQISNYGQKRRI